MKPHLHSRLGRLIKPLRAFARRVRVGGGPLYYAERPLRRAKLRAALAREQGPEDVTVVLGIRNRKDYRFVNVLRNLRGQDWAPELVQIVVVDYASDPAHVPWLREQCAAASAELARVENAAHWNKAHAQNIGIARARTRYVLSTDADILLTPNYLRRGIALLRQEPLAVVVAPSLWDLPEDWTARWPDYEQVTAAQVPSLLALAERRQQDGVDHLNGGVNLARTALYRLIRGYDEGYSHWGAEDDDLIKRMRSLGAELRMIDAPYVHQWHPRFDGNDSPELRAQIERNRVRLYGTHTVLRNPSGWGRV